MPPPMVPAPMMPTLRNRIRRGVLGDSRNARHGALGEEDVDHRLGLVARENPANDLALFLAALVERKRRRGFQCFERGQRCGLVAPDLARLSPAGRENRRVFRRRSQLFVLLACFANRLARDVARERHRAR